MNSESTIFLVDDEDTFREGLCRLLGAAGIPVKSYASAEDFLQEYSSHLPGCLVLDLDLPGMNGLELQKKLNERKLRIPIIFITGHADIPKSVQALKSGAIDFLEKPFSIDALVNLIKEALEQDKLDRQKESDKSNILMRFSKLTPRLKQVLTHLVAGNSNKEMARKLNLSPRTVEIHRKRVMEKMEAHSLPELVKLASICGIDIPYR